MASAGAPVAGERIGPFVLTEQIGSGSLGPVFAAQHAETGSTVAVKVVSPAYARQDEYLARLAQEAQAAAQLSHENLACSYGLAEDQGRTYLAMEHIAGEGLDAYLAQSGVLSPGEAIEIALQAARGLQCAHAHSLTHGSLRPSRIKVTPDGVVKVLGLGQPRDASAADPNALRRAEPYAPGQPHYLAPEQAQSTWSPEGSADIYALGAILYHCVTGRIPFQGPNLASVVAQQLRAGLPSPRDLNPEVTEGLAAVIQKMMARAPEHRYGNCGALADELERVRAGEAPAGPPLGPGLSSVATPGGSRRAIAVAAPHPAGRPLGVRGAPRRTGTPAHAPARRVPAWLTFLLGGVGAGVFVLALVLAVREWKPEWLGGTPPEQRPLLTPPEAWKSAVDLLALVDLSKDRVHGDWERAPAGLVAGAKVWEPSFKGVAGAAQQLVFARVELPYQLPQEYDLRVEFTREKKTKDGLVAVYVSKYGHPFMWGMGARDDQICGFSLVDGEYDVHNPTYSQKGVWLSDRRHVVVIQVRDLWVAAWMDGKLASRYATDYKDMSCHSDWALRDPNLLGLGAHESVVTFHKVELLAVTGQGKSVR